MINKDNIEIPYEGVMIFRNGLKNVEEIIKAIDSDSNWEPWYNIGEQIVFNHTTQLMFDDKMFPTRRKWDHARNTIQESIPESLKSVTDILEEAFYEATEFYFQKYPETNQENWMHGGSNILKYHGREATKEELEGKSLATANEETKTGEAGGTKDHTLPFHTDFDQRSALDPGPKAEYTITIYLNDDYVGGEIDFRFFKGNFEDMSGNVFEKEETPKLTYRPKPGDIIIFPSRPPYYHGVRRVEAGIKKFVRMFWMSWVYSKEEEMK